MNKQGENGIGWCTHTWNPVAGCYHKCRWQMPDGTTAICYAERVAIGVARLAYPQGFDNHYWHPQKLTEPVKLKEPARIFLDSMSDLLGAWVPDDQIAKVFEVCREASWHTFQLLTKNPGRLTKFAAQIPANVWVGVSMPPTWMNGVKLDHRQQERFMAKALDALAELPNRTVWLSLEPLSWNVGELLIQRLPKVDWLVVGAATNGSKEYQPDPSHVRRVLQFAEWQGIPVYMKGNLRWSPRQQDFPR